MRTIEERLEALEKALDNYVPCSWCDDTGQRLGKTCDACHGKTPGAKPAQEKASGWKAREGYFLIHNESPIAAAQGDPNEWVKAVERHPQAREFWLHRIKISGNDSCGWLECGSGSPEKCAVPADMLFGPHVRVLVIEEQKP